MYKDPFKGLKSRIALHGVTEISSKSGVSRSRLYDFIQGHRDLTTKNLGKIMETLNLKITNSVQLETVQSAAHKTERDGKWEIHFFNFVDDFRKSKDLSLIQDRPVLTNPRLKNLLASIVESLCLESEVAAPHWVKGIEPLKEPWFVSGIENLKASAIQESPVPFLKRNIFVLENFLERV